MLFSKQLVSYTKCCCESDGPSPNLELKRVDGMTETTHAICNVDYFTPTTQFHFVGPSKRYATIHVYHNQNRTKRNSMNLYNRHQSNKLGKLVLLLFITLLGESHVSEELGINLQRRRKISANARLEAEESTYTLKGMILISLDLLNTISVILSRLVSVGMMLLLDHAIETKNKRGTSSHGQDQPNPSKRSIHGLIQ